MSLWLDVRVIRKFRVGFFELLKFWVLKIRIQNSLTQTRTRHFEYPKFRVRVQIYPNYPINSTQICINQTQSAVARVAVDLHLVAAGGVDVEHLDEHVEVPARAPRGA